MNADAAFTETSHAEMKPMSAMAVTAFVLTLLFCIPVLPLVGLFLGLAALGRTATPGGTMRGRPLVVTAIILGILVTAGQVYTTVKLVEVAKLVSDSIQVVLQGPTGAIEAAFKGDSTQTNEWWSTDQTPSAAQTAAFVADATNRFGDFSSAAPSDGDQPPFGQATFSIPYLFTFSKGSYEGTAKFQATTTGEPVSANGRILGLVAITVVDTDGTKVVWSSLDSDLNAAAGDSVKEAAGETIETPAAETPAAEEEAAEKMDDQSPPSDP
jgi:hypothetical protein